MSSFITQHVFNHWMDRLGISKSRFVDSTGHCTSTNCINLSYTTIKGMERERGERRGEGGRMREEGGRHAREKIKRAREEGCLLDCCCHCWWWWYNNDKTLAEREMEGFLELGGRERVKGEGNRERQRGMCNKYQRHHWLWQ